MQLTDTEKVEYIRQWAKRLISCPHPLCSIDEAIWEKIYGTKMLKLVDENIVPD